ncbi:tRNA(Met) cytidine acetyltransferase TmcA [Oceanisphaera sp. W20_SRM_FM3]|uniref:tRNA(Met) cytidine acetyltransferase TmcA n=1 Tax=Oceanisphaera sp. W20_SRM_FM3 TaxID=3240267 RepID=UPI003F97BA4E
MRLTDMELTGMALTTQNLADWQHWRQLLRLCGERRLFVLAGEHEWAITHAKLLTQSQPDTLWLGQADSVTPTTPLSKFKTRLGQEVGALVFNAFSGLHPDALGAVAGTVKAGGILILLCPPLAHWPAYPDPDLVRYVAEPEQAQDLHSGFLSRFIRLLAQDTQVLHWAQNTAFPILPRLHYTIPWQVRPDAQGCLNNQQRHALAVILSGARRQEPVVLTADRGRGKSSLLGLAAARLIKAGLKVLLTAPSPQAVTQVQAHCIPPLSFLAPDALLIARPAADVLLIDEAAAIPVALLLNLARHYCCVFASTEHGYEGTGLGFQLKFQPQLLQMHPQTRKVHLDLPARWSTTDPLEPLLYQLLALNAIAVLPATQGALQIRWVTQTELLQNEVLLNQVFGLLTLAHYQTSPSDLRQLLDAPELKLAVMFRQEIPLAVALLIAEGQTQRYPLTDELSLAIWRGQRRPRGHLLAQSLAFHGGLIEACQFRYHRIMRIVVHPSCQHSGLGRQLIAWLQEQSQQAALNGDFLGASFGASPELLAFWQANHFCPVRVGQSRDTVSGLQAVMLLWPSSVAAKKILPHWQGQFSANVHGYRQTAALSHEQAALYQALRLLPARHNPELDRQIAHDFAFYHRDLISDWAALARFIASNAPLTPLSSTQLQLLNALLTHGCEPSMVAKQITKEWQLSGHKAVIAHCRRLLQTFFIVPSET